MDRVEGLLLGIIVIAIVFLVYFVLTNYVFNSSPSYGSQPGNFSGGVDVETNGSGPGGGIVVPVGGGNSGYFNP